MQKRVRKNRLISLYSILLVSLSLLMFSATKRQVYGERFDQRIVDFPLVYSSTHILVDRTNAILGWQIAFFKPLKAKGVVEGSHYQLST